MMSDSASTKLPDCLDWILLQNMENKRALFGFWNPESNEGFPACPGWRRPLFSAQGTDSRVHRNIGERRFHSGGRRQDVGRHSHVFFAIAEAHRATSMTSSLWEIRWRRTGKSFRFLGVTPDLRQISFDTNCTPHYPLEHLDAKHRRWHGSCETQRRARVCFSTAPSRPAHPAGNAHTGLEALGKGIHSNAVEPAEPATLFQREPSFVRCDQHTERRGEHRGLPQERSPDLRRDCSRGHVQR